MGPSVLLRAVGHLYEVDLDRRAVVPRTSPASFAADASSGPHPRAPGPRPTCWAGDRTVVSLLGPGASLAPLPQRRHARELLPWPTAAKLRAELLVRARRALEERLRDPEEALIALAREEIRVERARSRETGAADHWLAPPYGPLTEYAEEWTQLRSVLDQHLVRLRDRLESLARTVAPNLSELVGPRVAARLIAAAGGLSSLARMSGSRLQLLGARRRPSGGRGPKYGVLAPAVVGAEIPRSRWGAYARSLAAVAVIAARSDGTTRADLTPTLTARRDRRLRALRDRGDR